MQDIITRTNEILNGKNDDIKALQSKVRETLSLGYFELRKKYGQEQVLALSEIAKLVNSWESSDSQRAFLQFYYNQLGGPKVEVYDYHVSTLTVASRASFERLISFLIGAGIPGKDLDEFETWLDDDEQKQGDGYRLLTPNKALYGLVMIEAPDPRTWRVSFFGTKSLVAQVRDIIQ